MQQETKNPSAKVFSWTLWRYEMPLEQALKVAHDGKVSVTVRASARNGEMQTSALEDLYNVRGLLNNAPHVVSFLLPN